MAEQKNSIKLNGKLYDAKTGAPIGHTAEKLHTSASAAIKPVGSKTVKTKVHSKVAHHPHSASSVHKRTQHTRTLMRSAVKRPSVIEKTPVSGALDNGSSVRIVSPEPSITVDVVGRDQRLKKVKKSKLITRFGTFASGPSYVTKSEPLEVRVAPTHIGHQAVQAETKPNFTEAVHHATSHTQPTHKKAKRSHRAAHKLGISTRTFNAGTAALAIVLLVGFFAYQNKAGAEFRSAATKAGIHASLPRYTPQGFAMNGPVQYEPGEVTVGFRSNSDSRNYSISQQTSNWNTDALAANIASTNQGNYNSVEGKDTTVFMYGGGNATWVKNGVLYQINGDSTLSSDQLLKIANSL